MAPQLIGAPKLKLGWLPAAGAWNVYVPWPLLTCMAWIQPVNKHCAQSAGGAKHLEAVHTAMPPSHPALYCLAVILDMVAHLGCQILHLAILHIEERLHDGDHLQIESSQSVSA